MEWLLWLACHRVPKVVLFEAIRDGLSRLANTSIGPSTSSLKLPVFPLLTNRCHKIVRLAAEFLLGPLIAAHTILVHTLLVIAPDRGDTIRIDETCVTSSSSSRCL